MQNNKFKEVVAGFKVQVLYNYRMDWPGNRSLKSVSSFLPNLNSKDFLQKIEQNPVDVAMGDFMLKLLKGILEFDNTFFSFF